MSGDSDFKWCGGSGKWAQEEGPQPLGDRCPSCGGTGKVRVIIPGDKRPTRIRGAVVDAATVDSWATYDTVRPPLGPPGPAASYGGRSGSRIGGARVTFTREEGEVDPGEGDSGEPESSSVEAGGAGPDKIHSESVIVEECSPHGMFNRALPPGRYTVKVEARGFQPVSGQFVVRRLTEPIWLEEATTIPEKLDALVPECIERIPTDPYSREPLKLKRSDAGWVVYSVGPSRSEADADRHLCGESSEKEGRRPDISLTFGWRRSP